MPFSHWVKNLDYVIGPSSTSFYDCCAAGVQPICTRKIDEKRDPHIDEFSEENGPLMKHIETPNSIDEIIKIISNKSQKFELSKEIEQILLNETNYPESINSIDKIVDVSLAAKKKDLASPLMKNIYLIGFYLCGIFIIDLRVRISRLIKRKTEQGSSFLMTKENRKYIDSLTD